MNQYQIKDKSFYLKDYHKYTYGIFEWLIYAGAGAIVMGITGWIFYQNTVIVMVAALLGLLYPEIMKKSLVEKRRNILRLQFKDMLYYLSSSLSAGKSIEQAFIQVHTTIKNLYPNKKSDIGREIEIVLRCLQMNENIEDIMKNFAVRSGIEEIHHFADVFSVCKRTGGNLIEVIRTTSRMISERIEIKQEIETGLAGKRQEQRLLSFAPVVLVVFVSKLSGEFMEPLFSTEAGRIIMTMSLVMIGLGIIISNRIMDIRF